MTNTKNINTESISFTFRSKFEKLLNDENRPIITAAFEKFCKLGPDSARCLLWRLTFNTDIASTALVELGLNAEIIPLDKISTFRNELRSQYEQLRSNFLEVDVPSECQEAFASLKNHTDAIVANVVYEHCQSRVYGDEDMINRLLFLLSSDKENHFYGGIRSLYFSYEEADYLKPYHIQIHDMLNALHEHYKNQCGTALKNLPFEGLAGLIEEAGIELPFDFKEVAQEACDEAIEEFLAEMEAEAPIEAPAEEPAQTDSGFKPLTADAIIASKELFDKFVKSEDLNILCQIGKLGFDLNEVVAKKDKITTLLKAATAEEKATSKLRKATDDLEKAKAKRVKASIALTD